MDEMKQMVTEVVEQVKHSPRKEFTFAPEEPIVAEKKEKATPTEPQDTKCPACKKGTLKKGKNAWGCSKWKDGCRFIIPFEFMEKKLTDAQIKRLIDKGKSTLIKGFKQEDETVDGFLELTSDLKIHLVEAEPEKLVCPSCKTGVIVKGNTAWGCTNFKGGCKLRIPFELQGKKLTESHVAQLVLKGQTRPFSSNDGANKINGIFRFEAGYLVRFQEK